MAVTVPTYEKSWAVYALLYFGLIFSGFFWAETSVHRDILYIGGVIGIVFTAIGFAKKKLQPVDLKFVKEPLFILAVLFLSYSTLTILWSDPDSAGRVIKYLKNFFILPLFLFIYVVALQTNKKLYSYLISIFLISAALAGIYILFNHYILNDVETLRLTGVGRVTNPVALGLMSAIAALLLLFPDKNLSTFFKHPAVRVFGILLFVSIVVLCLSRGPLLAFAATFFILLILSKRYVFAGLLVILGLCFVGGFLISDWSDTNFLKRGSSGRLSAWQQGIEQIQEKPIFGHGVATKMIYEVPYLDYMTTAVHVHNIYLSHFIQGGVIGFLLFMVTFFIALKKAWIMKRDHQYHSVFTILLISAILGVVDFGGFHTSMGITWFVFWMPIGFLLAHYSLASKSSH